MTPTVDFATYCYSGDMQSLHDNFKTIVDSHGFEFNRLHVIYQRCEPAPGTTLEIPDWAEGRISFHKIREQDYDGLLQKFGIPTEDKRADEITHGPTNAHYWKNHVVNHLCAIDKSNADYIVFNDSDCLMVRNDEPGWIQVSVDLLSQDTAENRIHFCFSPSDGAPGPTQTMSQQLFIARRDELLKMDWNCWNGHFIEGGPMPEYYVMAEGRIGMYMQKTNTYRGVFGDEFRYWHSIKEHPVPDEFKEAVKDWV